MMQRYDTFDGIDFKMYTKRIFFVVKQTKRDAKRLNM